MFMIGIDPHKAFGMVTSGSLPPRALRLVRARRAVHVPELERAWNRAAVAWPNGADVDPLILHGDFEFGSHYEQADRA